MISETPRGINQKVLRATEHGQNLPSEGQAILQTRGGIKAISAGTNKKIPKTGCPTEELPFPPTYIPLGSYIVQGELSDCEYPEERIKEALKGIPE